MQPIVIAGYQFDLVCKKITQIQAIRFDYESGVRVRIPLRAPLHLIQRRMVTRASARPPSIRFRPRGIAFAAVLVRL